MDKITIKPMSKEVVLRGKPEDGHSDVFSYNYEGNATNGLGSLFIVGHVQPATEDTSYMVNLVASLAKREYYAQETLAPKEAFSKSLKKINEVLQEFFKNKDALINIGIFAIARENIFISRLGKFKIILARNGQDIDILNNIKLFDKEHIQEKEFSNIISGKIAPKDKIFAFYPTKSITARERSIKASLIALESDNFINKIQSIRQDSDSFYCAGVHITINKHQEPAIIKSPQPHELKKAMTPPLQEPKMKTRLVSTFPPEPEPSELWEADKRKQKGPTPNDTSLIKNKDTKTPAAAFLMPQGQAEEQVGPNKELAPNTPLIIPSEFSSAKKDNIFDKMISLFKIFKKERFAGRIRSPASPVNIKKQITYILPALVLLTIGGWAVKSFILLSPQEKELKRITKQAWENLKLAEEKVTANDLASARNLLLSSLITYSLPGVNDDFSLLLDKIDNAVSASLSTVEKLPEEISAKATILSSEKEKTDSGKYELTSAVLGFDIYQDNLYMLTVDKIYKVADAVKGSAKAVSWLEENTSLALEPLLIAVDGNVYVMIKAGPVIRYFKGQETKRFNTSITPENSLLITAKDLPNLYLVNKKLGRIYLIDKESGLIAKVIKIGNSEPLSNAYIDSSGTLYIVSDDNKIWKVE